MKKLIMNNTEAEDIMLTAQVPRQTKTYKPISHRQLVDLTLESIYQSGFALEKQQYSVAKDGNVANGRYTISNVADSEMKLQIAWQNSYDKTLALKFAIGASIIVCSNGMVSGDMGDFRKVHKGDIQTFTPSAISEYIKGGGDSFESLVRSREVLKTWQAGPTRTAYILGEMFIKDELISSTQLNRITRELKNPTFDYGAEGSLWQLYNHVTFAMRETSHPSSWIKDHIAIHDFFHHTCIDDQMSEISLDVSEFKDEQPFNQLEMF